MKIKTSELTGPALDWAVMKCEKWTVSVDEFLKSQMASSKFSYATVWAKGGPIIERERITLSALFAQKDAPSSEFMLDEWGAYIPHGLNSKSAGQGPTPLVAAMRCLVSCKLGEEVEIPEELL